MAISTDLHKELKGLGRQISTLLKILKKNKTPDLVQKYKLHIELLELIQNTTKDAPLFNLFVKDLNDKTLTIYDVSPEDTINTILEKVSQKTEFPNEDLRLASHTKPLQLDLTIKDYNIQKEDTLLLKSDGLKGGGKNKKFAGALLSWEPKMSIKLERHATQDEYDQFFENNEDYTNVKHKNSIKNAVWFLDPDMPYKADFANDRPAYAMLSLRGLKESDFIHTESDEWKGEAKHLDKIIVKESEKGAYGVGRNLLKGITMVLKNKKKKKKKKK